MVGLLRVFLRDWPISLRWRAVQELFEFLKMPARTMVQISSELRRREKTFLGFFSGSGHEEKLIIPSERLCILSGTMALSF